MHKVTKYMQKPCSLFNKCICVANYAQTVLKTSIVSDVHEELTQFVQFK